MELSGEADGEVADVDHLLNLAEGFGSDLAGLDLHERGHIVAVRAKEFAETTHDVSTSRRWNITPVGEHVVGASGGRVGGQRRRHRSVRCAVDR